MQDYVAELEHSWLEMHKKSALTHLVLARLAESEAWAAEIGEWIATRTGWTIHERALYRTLQRLAKQGLITHRTSPGHRTGAERKVYEITTDGRDLLATIRRDLAYLRDL